MRLEAYWGVGPKTGELLRSTLGTERAIEAIESVDIRTLSTAGVDRGRAIRILRRANGADGMALLGTSDSRAVYDDVLTLASAHAVTSHAADRIRVLTPLTTRADREARLDEVEGARTAWRASTEANCEAVLDAYEAYDEAGATQRAAVETAIELLTVKFGHGTFDALAELESDRLRDASEALGSFDEEGRVAAGVDEELDRIRGQRDAVARLEGDAFDVLEAVRERGVRDLEDFKSGLVGYVANETGISESTVRAAGFTDARDAADFVSTSLRTLLSTLESRVDERETAVSSTLETSLDDTRETVETAVAAVDDISTALSLARFAEAHDLVRPRLVDDGLAVAGARTLFLDADVQPVDYGVGDHEIAGSPSGDRVAVVTGANSGGKTTLLETLCSVTLLASMGLPVPADRAAVGSFDTVVFHRRHASFNAGVLESTLRSIVPPLTDDGRTLMLVDEFEAITEPGRAADLLNALVELTVDRGALGVYVTHLADELSPLPKPARIDGIFAEGLTESLELRVDYQPRFGTVGKSTPEFIVSRLVANARGRAERQGFEALAAAVGEEAVQRTLSDARWTPDTASDPER